MDRNEVTHQGRNRTLGAPYQTETIAVDFTTNHAVDAYMIAAVPLTVTLDPFAANNDQVLIQDVTDAAGTHPIVIAASEGQTILNGYGSTIPIDSTGGGVLLTMTSDGWVPTRAQRAWEPPGPRGPLEGQAQRGLQALARQERRGLGPREPQARQGPQGQVWEALEPHWSRGGH